MRKFVHIALASATCALAACGSSPSNTTSADAVAGAKTTNMTGACADYIAKAEEIMMKSADADGKMQEMTRKNVAKMKEDWAKMDAEEQAQANQTCQMLLDKFGDMLDKAVSMPAPAQ